MESHLTEASVGIVIKASTILTFCSKDDCLAEGQMKHCEWFEVFTVVVLCLFEEADFQHLWDQPLIKKK